MPTLSLTSALLLLGAAVPSLPWESVTWQQITGFGGKPWAYEEDAADNTVSTHVKDWTVGLAKKVETFVTSVAAKPANERDEYVTKKSPDNDSEGRNAWAHFVSKYGSHWGLNKILDQVLEEAGRSPATVCRELGEGKVSIFIFTIRCTNTGDQTLPKAPHAQIYDLVNTITTKLFGEDAYKSNNSTMLKPEANAFAKTLLTITWNRYRKVVKRDLSAMEKLFVQVSQTWAGEWGNVFMIFVAHRCWSNSFQR